MTTKRAVKKAMRADKVTTADIEGGTRYEVVRGECRAKFDLYEDYVNWVSLESPGGEGWTKDAHQMARELFPELGVGYLVAGAANEEADAILKAHGDWYDHNGRLRWDLGSDVHA